MCCLVKQVESKSVKQCVQFYYLWKKVCSEEYEILCRLNRHRQNQQLELCESMQTDELAGETCRPGEKTVKFVSLKCVFQVP